jgi:hypothetical protein
MKYVFVMWQSRSWHIICLKVFTKLIERQEEKTLCWLKGLISFKNQAYYARDFPLQSPFGDSPILPLRSSPPNIPNERKSSFHIFPDESWRN